MLSNGFRWPADVTDAISIFMQAETREPVVYSRSCRLLDMKLQKAMLITLFGVGVDG